MRFVVMGTGAIGGVIGGRLFEHGHDVTLIARGQYEVIRSNGLTLEAPDRSVQLPIPVVPNAAEANLGSGHVVLLTVKTQDTLPVLRELAASAPPDIAVVCAQNGVENERMALRLFESVYGMSLMCSADYLEPGRVFARRSGTTGISDVGRYPSGDDGTAEEIAQALATSSFLSEVRPDIMKAKYTKLLLTLQNTIDALFGRQDRSPENNGPLARLARAAKAEGEACFDAAGIEYDTEGEDARRRADLPKLGPGQVAQGGQLSSWQSLARGTGAVEADYFNGEVVLIGRRHGVPTPVNALLQRKANQMARARVAPGSMSQDEFFADLAIDI